MPFRYSRFPHGDFLTSCFFSRLALAHSIHSGGSGEVFTFGSNQWGALGAGDIATHHRLVRVRVPRASAIAAGSNHSAVLTRDGELYTFGSYQVLTLLCDSANVLVASTKMTGLMLASVEPRRR